MISAGNVYRDPESKVDYIIVIESIDSDKDTCVFHTVNVKNWMMDARYKGEFVANGAISCSKLAGHKLVAKSLKAYYKLGDDID